MTEEEGKKPKEEKKQTTKDKFFSKPGKKETVEETLESKVKDSKRGEEVTLMTDEQGNSYIFTKRKSYVKEGDEDGVPGEYWDIEVKDQNGDTVATAYSTLTEDGKTFKFDALSGETLEEGSTKGTFNKLWDLRQKVAITSGAEEVQVDFVNPRLQKVMERRYGYEKDEDGVHRRKITKEDREAGRIRTVSEMKRSQAEDKSSENKESDDESSEQRKKDKKKQLEESEEALKKIIMQQEREVRRDRHEEQILKAIQEYVEGNSTEKDLKGRIEEKIAEWQGTIGKGMRSGTVGEALISLINKGILEKLPTFSSGFLSERSIKEEELEHGAKRLTVGVELLGNDEEKVYNTELTFLVPSKTFLKSLINGLQKKEKQSAMRRSKTLRRKEILEKKIWKLEQEEKDREDQHNADEDNKSDDEPPPTQPTPPPEPPPDKGPSGGSSGHVHPGRRPTEKQERQARAAQKEAGKTGKKSLGEKVGDKLAKFITAPFRAAAGLNKAIEKDRKDYERKVAGRREERNRKGKKAQEERGEALNEAIRKGSVAEVAKVVGDNWGILARYFAQQAAGKASQEIEKAVTETVRQAVNGPEGSEEEPDDIYETGGNPWDDFVEAMKNAGVISGSSSSESSNSDYSEEDSKEPSWPERWGIVDGPQQRAAREELIRKEEEEKKPGPTLAQKWGIVDMPEEYRTQNPSDKGKNSGQEEPWYRSWGILEGEEQRAAREEWIRKASEGEGKKPPEKEPEEAGTLSDWFWGKGKYGPPEEPPQKEETSGGGSSIGDWFWGRGKYAPPQEKESTSEGGTSSRPSKERPRKQPTKKQRMSGENRSQRGESGQPGRRAMTPEEYEQYKEARQGTGGRAGGETGFANEYETHPQTPQRPTHHAPVPASTGPKLPPLRESTSPPPESFLAGLAKEAASRMEQYAQNMANDGKDPLAPGSPFVEMSKELGDVAKKVVGGKGLAGSDRHKVYKAASILKDVRPTEDIGKAGMKR